MVNELVYSDDLNVATYNGIEFSKDKRTGYYLAGQKTKGERRERLHRVVWETETGTQIPKGYVIHHRDHDKSNNDISNLELKEKSEHLSYHVQERMKAEGELERMRRNLDENARPRASEWHGSEEGHQWHVIHGIEAYKARKPRTYSCTYCGKAFETLNIYREDANHFCSNKCKSAFRRRLGVDVAVRICAECGKEYIGNKYGGSKYCEEHQGTVHRAKRIRKCV